MGPPPPAGRVKGHAFTVTPPLSLDELLLCPLLLCSDLEKVLALLHWPIISPPAQSLSPSATSQEVHSQLELLVSQLLALQTSYPSAPSGQQATNRLLSTR